jgi:hypothetical protein
VGVYAAPPTGVPLARVVWCIPVATWPRSSRPSGAWHCPRFTLPVPLPFTRPAPGAVSTSTASRPSPGVRDGGEAAVSRLMCEIARPFRRPVWFVRACILLARIRQAGWHVPGRTRGLHVRWPRVPDPTPVSRVCVAWSHLAPAPSPPVRSSFRRRVGTAWARWGEMAAGWARWREVGRDGANAAASCLWGETAGPFTFAAASRVCWARRRGWMGWRAGRDGGLGEMAGWARWGQHGRLAFVGRDSGAVHVRGCVSCQHE